MPFTRPTLTQLIGLVAADIVGALPPGAAPLLRFNNLGITGKVQARLTDKLYGRLDYIALQGTPFTVTDPAYTAAWPRCGAWRRRAPWPPTAWRRCSEPTGSSSRRARR